MSSRVKIFVVAHKPFGMPEGEALVPIHVGRAVSRYKEEMADYMGDDTGKNISEKNPSYCEMTAHYWIWKNVKDTDYVGVCHYRRYFGMDITEENIKPLMADADVIMVEPSWYMDSVYAYFAKFMGAENMTILAEVMKRQCPEYFETLEKVCDGVKFHPFNMLLCKKELFDEYCEWMFSILEACENIVRPAPYTNARRALAYMAEMLTGVYFLHRGMRIKSVPYYKIEDGQQILVKRSENERKALEKYEDTLLHELAWKVKEDRKEKFENPAILLGLKNDGIIV
jgi:hypothetical protein